MISTLIGIVLTALLSALVIYIVGRLNLGMQVRDFGSAFIAAIVIALTGQASQSPTMRPGHLRLQGVM